MIASTIGFPPTKAPETVAERAPPQPTSEHRPGAVANKAMSQSFEHICRWYFAHQAAISSANKFELSKSGCSSAVPLTKRAAVVRSASTLIFNIRKSFRVSSREDSASPEFGNLLRSDAIFSSTGISIAAAARSVSSAFRNTNMLTVVGTLRFVATSGRLLINGDVCFLCPAGHDPRDRRCPGYAGARCSK